MKRPAPCGTRGQTLVEFALVVPVLLVLLFASVDFGGYYGTQMSVQNAARVGVRFAATNPTAWSSSVTPTAVTIPGVVQRAATFATVPNNGSSIRITYWDLTGSTRQECGDASSGSFTAVGAYTQARCVVPGTLIQVTVTYSYTPWTPLPVFLHRAFATTSTSQMLEEQ